jgi:hypothetical protein
MGRIILYSKQLRREPHGAESFEKTSRGVVQSGSPVLADQKSAIGVRSCMPGPEVLEWAASQGSHGAVVGLIGRGC